MTLQQLAAVVASGKVTATQLVTRSLERIEEVDAKLGAVVMVCPERALERAAALDSGDASRALPLAGLPVLVKDNQDVMGLPTSHGSYLYESTAVAAFTASTPGRLEAAGAIIVGKTNLPELSSEGYTTNPRFGPTANPWNRAWNPGGSSGGSATALVAGLSAIATGNDGGGSIRIPAAWCGLLGLKPTLGLLGRNPVPAWMDLTTDGVLAQCADDLELLLGILAGPVNGDIHCAPPGYQHTGSGPEIPVRIVAVPRFTGQFPLPDEISESFVDSVSRLAALLGAEVEIKGPGTIIRSGDPDRDWFLITSAEQAWALGESTVRVRANEMDSRINGYLVSGLRTSLREYVAAQRRRYAYAAELDHVLVPGTVIVTPTATITGIGLDGNMPGRTTAGSQLSAFNTMLLNLTGHPALSMPAGLLENGLPFGLQIVARRWADQVLLNVAHVWEDAFPWPPTAPGYRQFLD